MLFARVETWDGLVSGFPVGNWGFSGVVQCLDHGDSSV